jgi:hypothetical protein
VALTELVKALGIAAGVAGGYAIASHIFNILWITFAGVIAMLALQLSPGDVFSLGSGGAAPQQPGKARREMPAAG